MKTDSKVMTRHDAVKAAAWHKQRGQPVSLVTGCFDVLHMGHLSLLHEAYKRGMVFVGINDDASVKELKGCSRPINNQEHRMKMLAAFEYVSVVFLISDTKVAGTLLLLGADYWIKGGDYTIETLDKNEVEAAKASNTEIVIAPKTYDFSSSKIISNL